MGNKIKKGGISILGIIILAFIAVFVLSYFKISIKSIVESPEAQDNLGYVSGGTKSIWDEYLKAPAEYLWKDVFIDIFWQGFISNMKKLRDGQPTDYETSVPFVNFNFFKDTSNKSNSNTFNNTPNN